MKIKDKKIKMKRKTKRKRIFATISNFSMSLSLKPNVGDLSYFKL